MAYQAKPPQDTVDCSEMGLELDEALEMLREQVREKNGQSEKHLKQNSPAMAPAVSVAATREDRFRVLPRQPRERRNWKRFAIDGAIVVAAKPSLLPVLRPSPVKLGPLKDISMKGLAVHYGEKTGEVLKKVEHLSIMIPGQETIVDRIPFKVVNRFKVADLPDGKAVWSLCVSFGRLLPIQKSQIEGFIDNFGDEIGTAWAETTTGSEA
ncbi:type IV pilus assembly PilZ [Desulfosudis oleivorans]|uniref:Type IV pilus assembly PilZ n=1 Tax=Desulfosudis oleivorans (strain DSM 6200 / JCM 39069 / Hxd3) TaxID=96561 RepID=A8ZVB5_DESOH|nr:type IV pilus assembly PilZ [Desulfosudis oleivorans]ABW66576.1 type IV pilus assembly PilZ [Desulfosudis oleivorans Hxd3]